MWVRLVDLATSAILLVTPWLMLANHFRLAFPWMVHIYYEVKPLYLPSAAIHYVCNVVVHHDHPVVAGILLGFQVCWWYFVLRHDDDDRWKRRRRTLGERVRVLANGRLGVGPALG